MLSVKTIDDKNSVLITCGLTTKSQSGSKPYIPNNAVYIFDFITNTYTLHSKLSSARVSHQSATIGGSVCLFGGIRNKKKLSDNEVIPVGLKFTVPPMHNGRKDFGMCSFAGCVFVAGGARRKMEIYANCEVYSAECGEWTEVSGMNARRCAFALTYFQGKVWAIGGASSKKVLDTVETYDLGENKWTTSDVRLLQKRVGHGAAIHGKKIFVIGGIINKVEETRSVEVYSSVTNQFTRVAEMNLARSYFGCSVLGNKIFVFGGYLNVKQMSGSVEVYDVRKDVWSSGPSLPLPLASFGCSSSI